MSGRQFSPGIDDSDQTIDEASRAEELKRSQAAADRPEQDPVQPNPSLGLNAPTASDNPTGPGQSPESGAWQAGGGETSDEPKKQGAEKPASGDGGEQQPDAGGSTDPAARSQQLQEGQAQAGAKQNFAASMAEASSAIDSAKEKVTEQVSRINNWMMTIEPKLLAKDICTCGLALFITLPIRLIFVTILGLELKHAMNGTKSMIPFFPTLTWKSFTPNGTNIDIPLPMTPLYVSVVAYFIAVVGAALVALTIIAIAIAIQNAPLIGFAFLSDLFAQ